jgi:hypothetical protein
MVQFPPISARKSYTRDSIEPAAKKIARLKDQPHLEFTCPVICIIRFRSTRQKEKHSPVEKLLPQLPAQLALSSAFMVNFVFKLNTDLAWF